MPAGTVSYRHTFWMFELLDMSPSRSTHATLILLLIAMQDISWYGTAPPLTGRTHIAQHVWVLPPIYMGATRDCVLL